MRGLAWGISVGVLILAATLRAAGASLVRTPRADALHDAADANSGAMIVAQLLEDRARIQPSISLMHSALLVTAALPTAWVMSTAFRGLAAGGSLGPDRRGPGTGRRAPASFARP